MMQTYETKENGTIRIRCSHNVHKWFLFNCLSIWNPHIKYILNTVQVQGKVSLCLISRELLREDIWASGVICPLILTSTLDGGEWSASRPYRFTPRERACSTHSIGGWVGPTASLDAVEKRKILHCRESDPGPPAHSPSLYRFHTVQIC
jgi:hypothetical protein